MKTFLVFGFVLIGLSASIALNYAAKENLGVQSLIIIYVIVLSLNVLRFFYWGLLLKRFDLSKIYPLTSLFFPLIYFYSIWTGESEISLSKLAGVGIIMLGVFVYGKRKTA